MKKISLRVLALVIVTLISLSGINMVRAASSVATLTAADNVRLKAGETINVSVNIASGYEGFQGKLEYDTSVFESVSMAKVGDWNADLSNNVAVIDRATAAAGTENVATLTLKVKSSISVGETTIRLTSVKASKGGATETANNATITIKAEEKPNSGSESGTTTPTTPATNSNKNTSVNTTKNTSKNTIQSSKTTAKRILNAGDATTMAIIAVVAVVAIVGCLGFIKYSKNKDIK